MTGKQKQRSKMRDKVSYTDLGFLPLQGDFTVEFDDKAEVSIMCGVVRLY